VSSHNPPHRFSLVLHTLGAVYGDIASFGRNNLEMLHLSDETTRWRYCIFWTKQLLPLPLSQKRLNAVFFSLMHPPCTLWFATIPASANTKHQEGMQRGSELPGPSSHWCLREWIHLNESRINCQHFCHT